MGNRRDPQVQSIYTRLLKNHPGLEGHNYNAAINGSNVENLEYEFQTLLKKADPLPDVIIVADFGNDMRCDGTDDANYGLYGQRLDQALTQMEQAIPGVRFFLAHPGAPVEAETNWLAQVTTRRLKWAIRANSGTGPCHVFDEKGKPRPAGIRSTQAIVDSYWAQYERVCDAHAGCFTDGRAFEQYVPVADDVSTTDNQHPSIQGHAHYAAIAWQAVPDEIKQAP